jgi:hypothetical protein
MTDGFAQYDQWKCAGPAGDEHSDPPDPHEQCEREIEELHAEIAQLHSRIDELEIELAACKESRP